MDWNCCSFTAYTLAPAVLPDISLYRATTQAVTVPSDSPHGRFSGFCLGGGHCIWYCRIIAIKRKYFLFLLNWLWELSLTLKYFFDISSSSPLTVLNSNQFYHRKNCLACGDCRAEKSRAHAFKVELGHPPTTMIWRETLRRITLLLGKIIRHSRLGCLKMFCRWNILIFYGAKLLPLT